VTSSKVAQIFQENDPAGTTNLAGVLKDATDQYFQRKASGQTKPGGETIVVVTDVQGRGDTERGRRGEGNQARIETPPDFRRPNQRFGRGFKPLDIHAEQRGS
jgi:hypothetical protein